MSTSKRREMKGTGSGHDFNCLKAHVSRCLLRQLCRRIASTSLDKLEEHDHSGTSSSSKVNHIQRFYGALLFVDISGFTALSTKLDIESLTTHINGYFRDMLAIIESFGGDVVKFFGDAMYIVWQAKSYGERQRAVLRAVACAKEIIKKCNNRTVSLSTTTFDNTEALLQRVALTESLLSGQSALDRDFDPNFDSNDDEDATTVVNCHETAGTFISDDLESQESPRSPRILTHRRRNSQTSQHIKPKVRRLSFPSFMKSYDSTESKDPEVASLNVHIGASVGVMAGIDVAARGRSEFFLTGQPLLDVSAAESLAKLGQIVVSKGVYDFLKPYNDLHNTYECVSAELECYRIMEPIILSYREMEMRNGPVGDVKKEMAYMLKMSGGNRDEYSQRAMLLRTLSSHVHQAARMQSPTYSRSNSPHQASFLGESMNSSSDVNCSGVSSVYSSTHSDDSFDLGDNNELVVNNTHKFERKLSFDNGTAPDESLSAELRELVVLFIKIDIDVSLSHYANRSIPLPSAPQNRSPFRPSSASRPRRRESFESLREIDDDDFKVDNFGFLERSPSDETADVILHGRFQECMTILADTFAEHGGQIGQYSCCEKGNVCLGTFGLRGSVQEDNAAAAIESAQTILVRLQAIGLNASIGVTSGKVYSGLVGSPSRHEYSIMGPAANLSSRLMCAAAVGTILSDAVTRNRDRSHLFLDMPMINAKGYSEPVRTYQPVLSDNFRRRLYSRKGSIDSWNESLKYRALTDDTDMFGMMAIDKLAASRNPETLLFGRNTELRSVIDFLLPEEMFVNNFPIEEPMKLAIVTGACGCGKTSFLASLTEIVSKNASFTDGRDPTVDLIFSGGSSSYDTTVPFNSWRPILTALIAAVSKQAKHVAHETDLYNMRCMGGGVTGISTFSPTDSGELRRGSISPLGQMNIGSAYNSKATSPDRHYDSPIAYDGCNNSPAKQLEDEIAVTPYTGPSVSRFNHLRAGSVLITDALPQSVLAHLSLVFKILPSFSKAMKGPKIESALNGAAKLQKTVEVLAALIQTAVDLLNARRIFITLDDVQSMDPSSWNLLTHMWRENTAISVLASFHSLCRSSARGKIVGDAGELKFLDFNDSERCKVVPLPPLDKLALSQLVGKMLEASDMSNSQIAVITEAAVDLSGGNPLFAREITTSAVETLRDTVLPDMDSALNSEAVEEATLSHVINTLRPNHRIEEIISLRFDRLTPSNQLVLKLASVVGKDGASFTSAIIAHLVKELASASADRNSANKSSKNNPKQGRNDSLAIVNLNSINVEETLQNILASNEFITLLQRSSHSIYSQMNQPPGVAKYKFKNVLIKKSIYDLMLNHQKVWSHQKVAEYLEAQALVRVAELRFRPLEDSDDEYDDGETTSGEGCNDSTKNGSSDCGRSGGKGKDMGTIADWNMLGVHWRLSNNLIKAMACFYESGHLIDSQGDIETARLLWTNAYQILCLMRKDSHNAGQRDFSCMNVPFDKTPPDTVREDETDDPVCAPWSKGISTEIGITTGRTDTDTSASTDTDTATHTHTRTHTHARTGSRVAPNLRIVTGPESMGPGSGPENLTPTIGLQSLGSILLQYEKDKPMGFENPQYASASEVVYHIFKGDSLALEVAVTLIIRLSQNVIMFEEQAEDIVNLNKEALELVTCTRQTILEKDAVTFVHVPRLSPALFLKGSSLLGPIGTTKERRQSINLGDGKKLFCLRDPSIIFPVLSGLCMRYSGNLLPDDELHNNWASIVEAFETTAVDSKIPVHIVRALSLKSLLGYCSNRFKEAVDLVDKMDEIYVYQNHSDQLIHIYGADRALMQYSFGAISCIMLGDFKRALSLVHKTEEYLGSLTHLQSVLTTSMLQFNVYLMMQMYGTAHSSFISLLSFISFNGGHHNMFHLYLPLMYELGKRLGQTEVGFPSPAYTPHYGTTRRGSASSMVGSVVSDIDAPVDMATLGDAELELLGYNPVFNYQKLLSTSLQCPCIDPKKNPIPCILALRYGLGTELASAELCLLEAKRLQLEDTQPQQLKRNSFTIPEEPSDEKTFWRNSAMSRDYLEDSDLEAFDIEGSYSDCGAEDSTGEHTPMSGVTAAGEGKGAGKGCDAQQSTARDFCEAGIRFIDFSLAGYHAYDSALNTLRCHLIKADLLVTLAKILESDRRKFRVPRLYKVDSASTPGELRDSARRCLTDALEHGIRCSFKLPTVLVGIAFVQLDLNEEKGKSLIYEFLLYLLNQDCPGRSVQDVFVAITDHGGQYGWMSNFPVLALAAKILRGE